ncbi:MAG: diacylglycerol/polyprenol kinase family protein [Candidatus Heimdallarchaeota archaeon]
MVFNPLGENLAILWDFIAMLISIVSLFILVQINALIRKNGKVSTIITRKLVHIFAGPIFIISWLLFSGKIFSRFIAMIVPILFVLQFIAIGTGKMKNESFVASMSRTGDPKELLGGTLYYAIIMVIITIFWFYFPENPTSLILIGCLSGGDGLADIIGRKYGGDKKFGIMGSRKTLIGTLAMFFGSFFISIILVLIFSIVVPTMNIFTLITPITFISVVTMIVEALSPKGIDNWTISVVVVVMALLFSTLVPEFWPFNFISF